MLYYISIYFILYFLEIALFSKLEHFKSIALMKMLLQCAAFVGLQLQTKNFILSN